MNPSRLLFGKARVAQKLFALVAMFAILTLSVPAQSFAEQPLDPGNSQAVNDPGKGNEKGKPDTGDTGSTTPPVVLTDIVDTSSTTDTTTSSTTDDGSSDQGNSDSGPLGKALNLLTALFTTDTEPPGKCELVSDPSTTVDGAASVPVSPLHSSWTTVTHGATWVWSENPINDPVNQTQQTFTKKFTITSLPNGNGHLEIAADNTYTVTLNGHQIGQDTLEDNYTESGSSLGNGQDQIVVPKADFVPGENTLVFTVTNLHMDGGTMATNPAGLLYHFKVNTDCTTPPPPPPHQDPVTIVASKVVCSDESMLPNWGAGGPDITASTAADWVANHPGCHLQPGWQFEWGNGNAPDTGDSLIGPAGSGYTPFGPTDANGYATTTVSGESVLHLREVQQNGYIPFTHTSSPDNSNDVSAEFYCADDVLNYDNWDFINNAQPGNTYHCVAFNAPVKVPTTTVKVCKVDDQQHPLAGWTLMLKGDHVGDATVLPDGNDHALANVPAGDYILTASGAYIYRPSDAAASTSDAAFSLRLPSDNFTGPYAPWIEENTFPTPNTGWLGIMFNNALTDWGHVFHTDHVYALGTTMASAGDMHFKILDDQYGDNSGSLNVSVDQGYVGVTGTDGCTTFNDVPYGDYTADELNQPGWTNVSGLGSVTVDQPDQTFTIVNHDTTIVPQGPSATLVAAKVVCTDPAEMPHGLGGADITASTAADWIATHQSCHLANGWSFGWGDQNAGDGGNTTIGAAANYTTFGPTTGGYATTTVPITGVSIIQAREELQDGYIPFSSEGTSAEFYCASDVSGYDNWEWISSPQDGATYHCVAFNMATPDDNGGGDDTTGTLTIIKDTTGGNGQFTFNITGGEDVSTSTQVTTTGGTGSSSVELADGTYSVTESAAEGWVYNSVDCVYDEENTGTPIANGESITITDGEDVTCTFHNTKNGDEGQPTHTSDTVIVRAADLETQDHATATLSGSDKWFFYNDNSDAIDNLLGTFVTGPATTPAGTGSAEVTLATNDRTNLGTFAFQGTALADIKTLQYSSYSHSGVAGANESPYLVMNTDFNGTGSWQKRLVYVPANNGAAPQDGWNTYDALNGGAALWEYSGATWPGTGTPGTTARTWNDIVASYPGIRILPIDGQVGVRVGEPGPTNYVADIDKFVIGIQSGTNIHTTTYDFEATEQQVAKKTTHHSNGRSGGSVLGVSTTTEGQVLGASCSPILTSYLGIGKPNPADQVIVLQNFLNGNLGISLPVTGFFGPLTFQAVKDFQTKYFSDILSPWVPYGLPSEHTPTGYVYKTTQWMVNHIACEEADPPKPNLP